MTITVTPTVELSNVPPRVRLDITASAGETATTVTRLDPDGNTVPVRTPDGAALSISGTTGLLYDYEMPYGAAVSYSSLESSATISAQVTVAVSSAWLIHPGVPALSMPVDFWKGSFEEETWDVRQGLFWPMGRSTPVVQTDGSRKAAASSMSIAIESVTDFAALRTLVQDAGTLLLNIPALMGIGVDTCYIAVGAIRNRRLSDIGTDPRRSVEMSFQIVSRPAGGTQAQRTYADVLAGSLSYTAVKANYPTYLELLAGP